MLFSPVEIWETPPVTPNDLLIGRHFPPPLPEPEQRVNPRHLMRSTKTRVQEFWNCWMKYFVPNLLPRNKWFKKRENLQEGDLVLVIEPTPRRTWKTDGLGSSDVSRTRWTCEESEDKDCYISLRPSNSQTLLNCNQTRTKLVAQSIHTF